MNSCNIVGRLTRTPEMRKTEGTEKNYCYFTIAFNTSYGPLSDRREKTDFINCIAWDKQAQNMVDHTRKGDMVAVSGQWSTRVEEDLQSKKKYNLSTLRAFSVVFLKRKGGEEPDDDEPNLVSDSDLPF